MRENRVITRKEIVEFKSGGLFKSFYSEAHRSHQQLSNPHLTVALRVIRAVFQHYLLKTCSYHGDSAAVTR